MKLQRQNDTGQIARVIVKHAREAFIDKRHVEQQWQALNYLAQPEFAGALAQYDSFAAALQTAGAELCFLPADEQTGMDSLYPRDAAVICERGAILCSMGKPARRSEPDALKLTLEKLGIPVCAAITGDGRLEGGDVVWLGQHILAVGQGYRTNAEGISQLRSILQDQIDELIVVPLPHWQGPTDVFHLMSMLSPLDTDLAAVYSPLLPVPFRQRLLGLGIELVEVPDEEFASQGCNILALAPRRALMTEGNPLTQARLIEAGVAVDVYKGSEISVKGGGGPTCLTRPLERFA